MLTYSNKYKNKNYIKHQNSNINNQNYKLNPIQVFIINRSIFQVINKIIIKHKYIKSLINKSL